MGPWLERRRFRRRRALELLFFSQVIVFLKLLGSELLAIQFAEFMGVVGGIEELKRLGRHLLGRFDPHPAQCRGYRHGQQSGSNWQ